MNSVLVHISSGPKEILSIIHITSRYNLPISLNLYHKKRLSFVEDKRNAREMQSECNEPKLF